MKAIIVPGVTDLNKGDQALVWESHRLIMDTNCFEEVFLVSTGDNEQERQKLCSQSERRGYKLVENILKHPRRGSHSSSEVVSDSKSSYAKLVYTAVGDFLSKSLLLLVCKNDKLVRTLFDGSISNSVKTFRDSDVVFVKGGGFIHAYGEATAPYLMWFFLFYVRLAKRLGKKVIFLPNSFGPFEGLTVKSQVAGVFNKLDKIYAREELSSHKLGKLLNKNIDVSPDLGFYLKMAENTTIDSILKKYNINPADKVVGITIRPWRFPGLDNPGQLYNNYLNAAVDLTNHLLELNYKVAFCNQAIGPNAHEDDRNAIKQVFSKVKHKNLVWIDENLPCDELKALYSNFYIFVGTRFHSVIFSLTSLVPSIAIGYGGNKAKGIMSDFDLSQYTIQIEETSGARLISMFNNLVINHDKVKQQLTNNIDLLNKKREAIVKDIKGIVINKV